LTRKFLAAVRELTGDGEEVAPAERRRETIMRDAVKIERDSTLLGVAVRAAKLIQLAEAHRKMNSSCKDFSLTVEEIAGKIISAADEACGRE
jgi:hypothetical protein